MKKMIKKVIVAVLAMAMALGMMTVATSAAAGDKTIVVVLSGELATGERLFLDIDGQSAGITTSALAEELMWDRNQYEFTKDPSNNKIYKIVVNGDVGTDKYCNIQIMRISAGNTLVKAIKYYPQNGRDVFNGNETVYITFDLNASDWAEVTASATDPTAITADEVEAAIAAIGTVVLTDECKGLIDAASAKVSAYNGATADIDNYSTYTAAKARWDELVENGAGTLKIHVKHNWSAVSVYTYGVNDGTVHAAGDWPGTAAVANANNSGWGDVTVTTESAVNVIVNGDGKQSETKYVVAGEYWITVSNDAIDSVSSTAPSGWSTGTVTPPPVDEDDDDDTTTPSQSSPADEDDDDDTTTPSQSSPADEDDDDDTTTPSQSSPADEDDDDDTTPSQSSPADDENGNGAGGGTGSGSVDDTPAGDNSMVAIFAILAVLAAAGVVTVVVAKRRAIEE